MHAASPSDSSRHLHPSLCNLFLASSKRLTNMNHVTFQIRDDSLSQVRVEERFRHGPDTYLSLKTYMSYWAERKVALTIIGCGVLSCMWSHNSVRQSDKAQLCSNLWKSSLSSQRSARERSITSCGTVAAPRLHVFFHPTLKTTTSSVQHSPGGNAHTICTPITR